jgi:hypothetical protein
VCDGFASRRCLTPSRGWPSSVSAASPGSQQLLGPLGKALGRSAIPRGRAAPIEASQRSGRTAAPRRQSLSPRCLRETAIAACPSQGGSRRHIGAGFSCTATHPLSTARRRLRLSGSRWPAVLTTGLPLRSAATQLKTSTSSTTPGASPVEPERPERLMAATSARVRTTSSSSTTPTTRELRRDDDAGVVEAAGPRVAVR